MCERARAEVPGTRHTKAERKSALGPFVDVQDADFRLCGRSCLRTTSSAARSMESHHSRAAPSWSWQLDNRSAFPGVGGPQHQCRDRIRNSGAAGLEHLLDAKLPDPSIAGASAPTTPIPARTAPPPSRMRRHLGRMLAPGPMWMASTLPLHTQAPGESSATVIGVRHVTRLQVPRAG